MAFNTAMKEIAQIRLENARRLAEQAGGTTPFAHKVDREPTQMSRVMGANPSKNIGSRLARHIESCFGKQAGWLDYDHGSLKSRVEGQAQELVPLASPRSQRMLGSITQAAQDGRLTEDDLVLLERIASRIAANPAAPDSEPKNHNHERLKAKLGENDSSAERDSTAGAASKRTTGRD